MVHRARPVGNVGVRELARRARELRRAIGLQLRRIREDAGLTRAQVARAAGIDRAHYSRIETGEAGASLEVLLATGAVLGADLGVRYFAGAGPRIRDRFQAPIVEALLRVLHESWVAQPEVPVVRPVRGGSTSSSAAMARSSPARCSRSCVASSRSFAGRPRRRLRSMCPTSIRRPGCSSYGPRPTPGRSPAASTPPFEPRTPHGQSTPSRHCRPRRKDGQAPRSCGRGWSEGTRRSWTGRHVASGLADDRGTPGRSACGEARAVTPSQQSRPGGGTDGPRWPPRPAPVVPDSRSVVEPWANPA